MAKGSVSSLSLLGLTWTSKPARAKAKRTVVCACKVLNQSYR